MQQYLQNKKGLVENVFDQVYDQYDLMNDFMSFGIHRLGKKNMLNIIHPSSKQNLKDVACGNGDIEILFLKYFNKQAKIQIWTPNQEKKNNADIKEFCEVNFDINFPLTTLTEVQWSNAHELFLWAKNNHGKSAIPNWNFHNLLINREGTIDDTFASLTNQQSQKIRNNHEYH